MHSSTCGRCSFPLPAGAPPILRPIPERFDDKRVPVCAVCAAWLDDHRVLERLAAGVAAVDRAVSRAQAARLDPRGDDGDLAALQGHPLARPIDAAA